MTENRETELLAGVPDSLFIGGRVARGRGWQDAQGLRPRDRRCRQGDRGCLAGRRQGRARRSGRGVPGVGRDAGTRARRDAPPGVRSAAGAQGGLRAPHDDRDGQASRRGARRGRLRRRVHPVVQRGDGAHPGPLRPEPRGHRPHDRVAASGRPVLPHHAVELPARDGDPQDRAGARRRLHRGHQAGRAHASHDARLREAARGCRTARRAS